MAYRNEWMVQTKEELEKNGIRYEVADFRYYIFYCYRKSDGARYTYYAGSGRILGVKQVGINALITLCNETRKELVIGYAEVSNNRFSHERRFTRNTVYPSESGRSSNANAGSNRY